MAVNKVEQTSRLIVKVETGINTAGQPVYRQRSFANLNPALSDEDVLAIGTALGALQQYRIEAVGRQDNAILASV